MLSTPKETLQDIGRRLEQRLADISTDKLASACRNKTASTRLKDIAAELGAMKMVHAQHAEEVCRQINDVRDQLSVEQAARAADAAQIKEELYFLSNELAEFRSSAEEDRLTSHQALLCCAGERADAVRAEVANAREELSATHEEFRESVESEICRLRQEQKVLQRETTTTARLLWDQFNRKIEFLSATRGVEQTDRKKDIKVLLHVMEEAVTKIQSQLSEERTARETAQLRVMDLLEKTVGRIEQLCKL